MSFKLPELDALESSAGLIRIPDQIDVPLTPRVRRIIDTAAFQRLARIPQLGLVQLVYPGATHTRFEHSLGVYRNALLFIRRLVSRTDWNPDPRQLETLVLAALLHDVGHWPYCHPIEDLAIEGLPHHEAAAAQYIRDEEIATLIHRDWSTAADDVISLLNGSGADRDAAIMHSILSGPIDVDKLDYLYRDSVHCGVPYGRNFDVGRLVNSLTINSDGTGLAITTKGKTAAELMVFARYVMFSEVYWHHAVRSATAMFQRAFYDWLIQTDSAHWNQIVRWDPSQFVAVLRADTAPASSRHLGDLLFGERRRLYKRAGSFSCLNHPELYRKIAQQPFAWLVDLSNRLARRLSDAVGRSLSPHDVLIDAPPVGLEVQFAVQVFDASTSSFRPLGEVSPVVQALATRQFDDFVKQVRIFVDPSIAADVRRLDTGKLLDKLLDEVLEEGD